MGKVLLFPFFFPLIDSYPPLTEKSPAAPCSFRAVRSEQFVQSSSLKAVRSRQTSLVVSAFTQKQFETAN